MPATGMFGNEVCINESGGRDQSDVFVMVGLLVDAYRLRKTTMNFDQLLKALFDRHPGHPAELKTRAFINGRGDWNVIPGEERKQLLRDICAFAADGNQLFAVAISLDKFDEARGAWFGQPILACGGDVRQRPDPKEDAVGFRAQRADHAGNGRQRTRNAESVRWSV